MQLPTVLRFLFAVLLFAALTVAPLCADEPVAADKPSLRQGGALTADELAKMLGIYVWKFDVTVPAGDTRVSLSLELREKGVVGDQPFGAGSSDTIHDVTKRDVSVALIPINGTISDADEVRVVITNISGSDTFTITKNPFKQLDVSYSASAEDNNDGTFNLIGGFTNGSTMSSPLSKSNADKIVVLKIETSKQ